MKKYKLPIIITFLILSIMLNAQEKSNSEKSIYNHTINSIDGEKINLADFKGKKILFVNVASECGFTKQYKDLQTLHEKYQDKLVIIGLPCNQFGGQEPGTSKQIQTFCQRNFGVEFLITEKIDVKGNEQHPIYTWLTKKEINGKKSSSVKWNFQKYLVDENGHLLDYYYSITNPMSEKITKQI